MIVLIQKWTCNPHLVDLILIGSGVKLFGNHEGRVIGFQEALLVRPRVQVA